MKQDYYKFDLQREFARQRHLEQMAHLRHKTHVRIEALEAALNEIKLVKDTQVEQALMAQADAESFINGLERDEATAKQFMLEHERNTEQAATMLDWKMLGDDYSQRIFLAHRANGKLRRLLHESQSENDQIRQQIDFTHEKILAYHDLAKHLLQESINVLEFLSLVSPQQVAELARLVTPEPRQLNTRPARDWQSRRARSVPLDPAVD